MNAEVRWNQFLVGLDAQLSGPAPASVDAGSSLVGLSLVRASDESVLSLAELLAGGRWVYLVLLRHLL